MSRDQWHPRGEQTWPEWRQAVPGVTRIEHVRTGRRGTFMHWPHQIRPGNPGYAVIEWEPKPGALYQTGPSTGRVVAYAWDLREVPSGR